MEHLGEETAVDYLEGRLPEDLQQLWAAHLEECQKCRESVNQWKEILDNLKPSSLTAAPPEALARAIEIFPSAAEPLKTGAMAAKLVFDSLLNPAFAGVRGNSNARQVLLRTENLDIDLHITEMSGRTTVWGQLLPRMDNGTIGRVQVTLLSDGERVQSVRTSESGEFRFEDVPPGELSIGVYVPAMSRQVFGVFKIQRN